MKFTRISNLLSLLLLIILVQGNDDNSLSVQPSADDHCHPWSFYNHTNKQCECYSNAYTDYIVKCTEHGTLLRYGYCMTFKEGDGFYVGQCKYFDLTKYHISDTVNYIKLPDDVSDLNEYMCTPLNRKNESDMCGECMEGYGISVASVTPVINRCEKCSDSSWLHLVGYLFLEFLQVVVTYCVILIFRIKFTSSPLIVLMLYCQMQELAFRLSSSAVTILNPKISTFWGIQIALCGVFNLDIWRYTIPAFCTSSIKTKVAYLSYVPFIYLLLLLILCAGVCIKLYSKNIRPIIWLWSKLNGLLSHINVRWDTVIDTFATIFFLSYSNLVFTSIWTTYAILPKVIWNAKNVSVVADFRAYLDPSTKYLDGEHLTFVIVSFLITYMLVLPLPILLALYPIKCFRSLFFRCPVVSCHMGTINTFLDKFYYCYRDGLNGGRDMRSFVSFYYFVHWLTLILTIALSLPQRLFVNITDIMFSVMAILIAVVQPYKKPYMNIADTLVLANLGLFFHLLDQCRWQITVSSTETCYILLSLVNTIVPVAVIVAIGYRVFVLLKKSMSCCRQNIGDIQDEDLVDQTSFLCETPDHLLDSEQHNQENKYGSTERVLAQSYPI